MLHVAPDERGADTRLITVYDPTVATIACEVGIKHLRLAPNATVRLARVSRLSQGDALALGMHTMCKGNTTPIIPGGHVLAGLREFASEGRGLMYMIEDPYERVFTSFHAKLSAHARTGRVGTSVGASYGRVLVSLFRMFTSTDLDIESGPLCALVRATPNGHCRIVDEASIEELVEQIRDRHKHEDGGVTYSRVLYQIVTGKPYTTAMAAAGMGKVLESIEKSAVDGAGVKGSWKTIGASIAAFLATAGGVTSVVLKNAAPALDAAAGAAASVDQTMGAWSFEALASAIPEMSWPVIAGLGLFGAVAAKFAYDSDKERHLKKLFSRVFTADHTLDRALPFSALSHELAMLVPATELAYHVALAVAGVTEITAILAEGTKTNSLWARVTGETGATKPRAARAVLLEMGLPSLHADVDVVRGLYWMLVSRFVQTQILHIEEIVGRYTEHINRAVRGHATESGVAMRTNVTREPRAVQVALDSVPIGACVYGHSASGALAVMRRTALDTFDEYSVKEHDRGIQLEQNTLVHAADLAHRVMQGERLYGPVYDADELLGPRARRTKKKGVFSTTRVTCEFVPHAILPMSFAARGLDNTRIEKYAAFLSDRRWKDRGIIAGQLGGYAGKLAAVLGLGQMCNTWMVYGASTAAIGTGMSVVVVAAAFARALVVYGPEKLWADSGNVAAWFPGSKANREANFEDARKEIERAPTLYTQLSPALRDAIHGINPLSTVAREVEETVLPFDYMSVSSEAMQGAKSTLGVSAAILRQCTGP
jgi:hypothetical protein